MKAVTFNLDREPVFISYEMLRCVGNLTLVPHLSDLRRRRPKDVKLKTRLAGRLALPIAGPGDVTGRAKLR